MAKIPIILEPGRADGKLTTSDAIFDENKGIFQSEINDIQNTLNSDNPNKPLSAKQGKILKELLDNKVIEAGGIPIDTEPIEGNITHLVNSDGLAKEFNKHNTAIIQGNVYDVSFYNNGAVFDSIQSLLNSSNLSTLIPTSVRHGGMSIKFIQGSEQSSDNKYVQYRLMADTFKTTVSDWQGVDDKPTAGSQNFVKSGGVANKLAELEQKTDILDFDSQVLIFEPQIDILTKKKLYAPYLKKGRKYRFTFLNKGWDISGATSTYTGFSIGYYPKGQEIASSNYKSLVKVNISELNTLLEDYYDIEITDDWELLSIELRASEKVYIRCEDITKEIKLKNTIEEVIGKDITLSTTGGGSEWRSVIFNVDGNHSYTLKINGITDASNEDTLFLNIYTTTDGVRINRYYVKHGGTIPSSYFIPEKTTIIEVFARFYTNETMLATLSCEGVLYSIEEELDEQVRLYDEFNFIVGTIYDGNLVNDTVCLSNPEYIIVKPNQKIRFSLGDSLRVRISEYDLAKNFIKSTGYDVFTSLLLDSTTSFIRVSLNYSNRGYSSENPITNEAYSAGDFRLYVPINTTVEILQEKQEEMNKILAGKQNIINGSRNLYDANTAIDGYIDAKGVVHASDVKATDFIYCYGKKQVTTNYGGRSTIYLCFYDKDKNFLSSVLQHNVLTFDIPDKAVYFRSNMSAYSSTNMIVFGDTMPEYESYKGVDYIFSQLSKVDNLITEKEDSVISLNEDKSVALSALRNAVPNKYSYPNRNLFPLFSIATDIHSDWDRLKRVLEYSEEVGINSILCLGDIGDQQGSFDAFDWQNFVLGASIPVLTIPGNHEFVYNSGQTFYTGYTDETLAAKIYNEALVAHNGETHPNGKNYWHKDISYSVRGEDKILRIIGIYQYEFVDVWENGHPVHTQGTTGKDMPYYKQEQIDWLVGLLDSAESNTDVVILMHHAPTNNLERVDNTWNPAQLLGINIISGVNNNINNDFIPQIIDAWINGTTVDASSTMTNDNSVISVSHTFSSTHHGKFVGYITGHSHYDAITKIVGMEEQYVFCNTCTTAADIQQDGDLPRNTSGKLQDSFNIIAYDCIKHRIGIVKIGSDVSVDMRDKKYACNFIIE